jgi:hypothetical protein
MLAWEPENLPYEKGFMSLMSLLLILLLKMFKNPGYSCFLFA